MSKRRLDKEIPSVGMHQSVKSTLTTSPPPFSTKELLSETLVARTNVSPEDSPLHTLLTLFRAPLKAVDQILLEQLKHTDTHIQEVAEHIISAGGKRIRPLITLIAAHLCHPVAQSKRESSAPDNSQPTALEVLTPRAIPLASCIELIHTATLLHDDVLDQSALRRMKPAAHTIWGNSHSILVGDYLIAKSFGLLIDDEDFEIQRVLAKTLTKLVEGEVRQLNIALDLTLNETDYLEILQAKTAFLFSTAAEFGALSMKAPHNYRQALARFGIHFGTAFQLIDDLLDYAPHAKTGKTIGKDFEEGKITLPVIYAYTHDGIQPTEKDFITTCFQKEQRSPQEFEKMQEMLSHYKAFDQVKVVAKTYIESAVSALETFPDSPLRQTLIDLAHFIIERHF